MTMATYCRIREKGLSGELRDDDRCSWLREQLGHFRQIILTAVLLKQDPAHSVLVVTPAFGDGAALLCKFFPARGFGDRVRQGCGLDRPARMHRRLKKLPDAQLPIPPSLGHISLKGFGSAWFCPLVGGKTFLHWAGQGLPSSEDQQLQLLNPVVDAMLGLHQAGFVHGDFKWGNVLYDSDQNHCWLVDVDGVSPSGPGFSRGKARDLGRFLLDCEEAGVSETVIPQLLARYACSAALDPGIVRGRTEPVVSLLRQRHSQRYGPGHRLELPGRDC